MGLAYGLLFGVFAILGGVVWLLVRSAKTSGITEATLTETEEDLKGVTEAMKGVQDAEKTRAKAIAYTRAGIIPSSLRQFYKD